MAGPNRERSKAPKRGRSWCFGCDQALVADGQKCPNCGVRKLPRRRKK